MLISVFNFTTFLLLFFTTLFNKISHSDGENIIIIGAGVGSGGSVIGDGGDNTINVGGSGAGNGFGPLIVQGGGKRRKHGSTIIIIGGGRFGASTDLINRREIPKKDNLVHLIPFPIPFVINPLFDNGWH